MQRHGWTLLFHDCLIEQLQKLHEAAQRAQQNDPVGFASNANFRLFRALSHLMLELVPSDPARQEYRQGNTLGPNFRHWRRAKIGRRFRLFFRYDSRAKVIVWNALVEASRAEPFQVPDLDRRLLHGGLNCRIRMARKPKNR
jgi:toxin YhaV